VKRALQRKKENKGLGRRLAADLSPGRYPRDTKRGHWGTLWKGGVHGTFLGREKPATILKDLACKGELLVCG